MNYTILDLQNRRTSISDAKVALQDLYSNGYIEYHILRDGLASLSVCEIQIQKWTIQAIKEQEEKE
jgi:hypothetical protein